MSGTTRLIDHQHRRTWRLTEFFGNDGSSSSSSTMVYTGPVWCLVPYAAVMTPTLFVSWQVYVGTLVLFVPLFVSYCVAVNRAKLATSYPSRYGGVDAHLAAMWDVQKVQRLQRELPSELGDALEDSLQHCYRAIRLKLDEHELQRLTQARRTAAQELFDTYRGTQTSSLSGSEDLERLKVITQALKETSSK